MVMSKVASLGGLDLDETPFWTDMVALFHPTRRV
jgi:hypothetical protein